MDLVGVPQSERPPLSRHQMVCWLGAAMLAGAALRIWAAHGGPLHPDELHYAWDALSGSEMGSLQAIRDMHCEFLIERRSAHPMLATLLTRWLWILPLEWMWDSGVAFPRGFNVLAGVASIPLAAWIATRAWGARHGMLAAWLVAVCPLLAWVSGSMYLDSVFTLAIGGMVGFLLAAQRQPAWRLIALAGVCAGLALATKISGPIVLPILLVGVAMVPTTIRRRALLALAAFAAAAGVWLLWCDPGSYIEAIRSPTDPRYADRYQTLAPHIVVMSELRTLGGWVVFEVPATLALLVGAGLMAWTRREWRAEALLWLAFLGLLPLVLLHVPSLSGPHGFAPIVLFACVLGSRVVALRLPVTQSLVAIHVMGVVLAMTIWAGAIPLKHWGPFEIRERRASQLERALVAASSRHVPVPMAFYTPPGMAPTEWSNLMRNGILSRGIVAWVPEMDADRWEPGPWDAVDVVAIASPYLPNASFPVPPEFELEVLADGSGWIIRRQSGAARSSWAREDLTPVDEALHFPMRWYPATARVLWNQFELPIPGKPDITPRFDGRWDAMHWGTGRLSLGEDDGTLEVHPAGYRSIFWNY